MQTPRSDELTTSQQPAIDLLTGMNYQYLPAEEAERMRGNLYNVLLKDILKKKLHELNGFEYKGETYAFSDGNIEQAIRDLDESLTDGLVKTNEKIYESMM